MKQEEQQRKENIQDHREREKQREREKEQKEQEKSISYWSNFRRTDYYVPQEWRGDKPSKDRTSDEEFDGIVQDYLWNPNEGYEQWITKLFIGEFAERRKAQPNFTNIKEETKKREEAKKREEVKRKTETKKRRNERKLTEIDLKGTYYDLLLVPNYANTREIRAAYRQLVLICHPDRNPKERKLAEKITKKLNKAKEVLLNRDGRKKYDDDLSRV